MATKRITQKLVERLRPPAARVTISDTTLEGFQLRYWRSTKDRNQVDGSYSILYWSPVTGKRTRYTIGSIHKWKLGPARDNARTQFDEINAGRDPQLDKKRQRPTDDPTPGAIKALITEFDKRYLKARRKSPDKVKRTLERELLEHKPSWRDWPISEVTKGDIHAKLDRLTDQGKGYQANRLLEAVRLLFAYAVQRGYIDTSPADGIRKPTEEGPRRRVLDDEEIKAIWPAFESLGYPFAPFYQILLLTGQRSGEVAGMTWDELDLDNALWEIPADRTKSDRAHKVPLSPWAVKILKAAPKMKDNPHVFSGRASTGNGLSGFSRAGERAREAAKVDDWRPHDLRRTVRTRLGEIGTPPHVAELVMNHTVKGLQAVYDRYEYTKEKREALDRWAEHLAAIVKGKRSKVVGINRG